MEPIDTSSSTEPRGTLRELSDPVLWKVSGRLGRARLHADRKFLAAVAEIARRGLIEKKRRFRSIQEYAAKVGGVSGETVSVVLRLARTFEEYPRTWEVFAAGRIGWTSLRIVAPHLHRNADVEWACIVDRATRKNLEDMVASWRLPARAGASGSDLTGPADVGKAMSGQLPLAGIAPKNSVPGDGMRTYGAAPGATSKDRASGSAPETAKAAGASGNMLSGSPLWQVPPTAQADRAEAPRPPDAFALPPELLRRFEARRAMAERKLGRPLDVPSFLGLLLDATEPRSAESPTVPRKVLPGQPSGEYVQVIYTEAESGHWFLRTRRGFEPVPIAEQLLVLGEPLASFEAATLEAEARASAADSRGREPPPVVVRWVWLRSGGACESGACERRGEHLHHQTRRAEQVDHSPERSRIECFSCHHANHVGLIRSDGTFGSGDANKQLEYADQSYLVRWQAARQPGG